MQVATNGNIKETDMIKASPNRFIISYMQPEFHNLLLKIFVQVFLFLSLPDAPQKSFH